MFIYFARVDENNQRFVKIGKAGSVPKRLSELRRGGEASMTRPDVTLLAAVKGNGSCERFVHTAFSEDRISTAKENFRGSEDLLRFIRWLRDQYFVSIDETKCDQLPDVTYDFWSPDDNLRRIHERQESQPLFGDPWEFSEPNFTADDYHTPESIIKPVREFMDVIDLDPASHPQANRNIQAKLFYTRETNGLTQSWYGRVWLNPPFSLYSEFANKLLYELNRGNITELLALHALGCQSAYYMQPVLIRCDAKLIIAGRHNHAGKGRDKQSNTGHGLLYFGTRTEAFREHFQELGTCWKVMK